MLKLLATAVLLLLIPTVVFAAIVPCGQLRPDGTVIKQCTFQDFILMIVVIFNLLLGLIGLISIFMLIFAGMRMLIYQFDESPEQELQAAKLTVRRALFGVLIVSCAFLIVQTLLFVLGVRGDYFNNEWYAPLVNLFS